MKPLEGQESLFNVGYSDVESNTLQHVHFVHRRQSLVSALIAHITQQDFGNFYSVNAKAWAHSFTAVPVAGFCACDLPCGVAHSISTKYWVRIGFVSIYLPQLPAFMTCSRASPYCQACWCKKEKGKTAFWHVDVSLLFSMTGNSWIYSGFHVLLLIHSEKSVVLNLI